MKLELVGTGFVGVENGAVAKDVFLLDEGVAFLVEAVACFLVEEEEEVALEQGAARISALRLSNVSGSSFFQ